MIGICTAMEVEGNCLHRQMKIKKEYLFANKRVSVGEFQGKNIVLIVGGIGKVNTAMATQYLIDNFDIDTLINFGIVGGVSDVKLGEIYYIDKVIQSDFDLSEINHTPKGQLEEFLSEYLKTDSEINERLAESFENKVLATEDIFTSKEEKTDELLKLGINVVDMEGASFLQVGLLNKKRVGILKCVSNMTGKNAKEEYENFGKIALENLSKSLKFIFLTL